MQIPTKIYFICSLTWMPNLFWHRKGQTEDGEIKESGKKKSPAHVGPCHHGMARPRVADGGTASNMEGSCE